MANYYNEINKLLNKLMNKGLMFSINGLNLGDKGERFTLLEILILRRIALKPGQRISNLIDDININRSQISSLIKVLINMGCVEKIQSQEDGRVYLLNLTEYGNKMVEKSYQLQKKQLEFVLKDSTLNEEKAVLKFLSKLNQLDKG